MLQTWSSFFVVIRKSDSTDTPVALGLHATEKFLSIGGERRKPHTVVNFLLSFSTHILASKNSIIHDQTSRTNESFDLEWFFCFSCPCKILEVFSCSTDLWTEIDFFLFLFFFQVFGSLDSMISGLKNFYKNDYWPLWKFLWILKEKSLNGSREISRGGCLSHGKLITFYYPIDHFLFKLICTVCVHIIMVCTVFENHYKVSFCKILKSSKTERILH